ncbi:hypothetical protein VTL71DRAFT_14998 [Oculimacula yallundae]|uniref:Uncharacterized protein n=1 Tax=Oculimacula yallundae TaxID=86028 RepID=A0ABR4CGM3_9HELO
MYLDHQGGELLYYFIPPGLDSTIYRFSDKFITHSTFSLCPDKQPVLKMSPAQSTTSGSVRVMQENCSHGG